MTNDSRHICVEDWHNILTDTVPVEQMEWNGYPICIRSLISLEETVRMVSDIINLCIDPKTGAFIPELLEFAIRSNVVLYYSDAALPDDLENRYRAVFETSIYTDLADVINTDQLKSIRKAIDTYIDSFGNMAGGDPSYDPNNCDV